MIEIKMKLIILKWEILKAENDDFEGQKWWFGGQKRSGARFPGQLQKGHFWEKVEKGVF